MQKKALLKKSSPQSGSRPLMKWLMWAALALVILVAVTPLINRQKNHKELSKKPVMEKGSVFKEVPKSTASPSSNPQVPEGAGSKAVRGAVPGIESTPVPRESSRLGDEGKITSARERLMEEEEENPPKGQEWVEVKPPEPAAKGGLEKSEPMTASSGQPSRPEAGPVTAVKQPVPAVKPAVQPGPQPSVQPAPKETKKQKTASLAPQAVKPVDKAVDRTPDKTIEKTIEKPVDKTSRQGQNETAAKPAVGSGKVAYCVQVGSFRDKRNAEVMQQNLQKRGYSVNLTEKVHPKLGQIYVVQLQAVDDMSKASTLVEQIKHEEKVRPVILKTPKE